MRRQRKHRRLGRVLFISALFVVTACIAGPMTLVIAAPTLEECLGQNRVVRITGTHDEQVEDASPSSRTTFDAREATFTSYPGDTLYPISVGKDTAPKHLCLIGGTVIGQQPRDLTWDEMKDLYSGSALRIGGNRPYVVDGLRVDNVADGIRPRGTEDRYPKDGDGFVVRNTYMTYIRDDCIENDDIGGGLIFDSLFDGCYTGISERPTGGNPQEQHPAPRSERLVVDHVLLRLQAQPGVRGSNDPSVLGHGQLFKWSPVANLPIVRDSIFLVETVPNTDSSFPFPPGTTTTNVTIVWAADAPFEWDIPPGTTVTTDLSVWTEARQEWLDRHGCTDFLSCTNLTTPDPAIPEPPLPGVSLVARRDANDTRGTLDIERLAVESTERRVVRVTVRTFGRWDERLLRGSSSNTMEVLFDAAPGGGFEYRGLIYERRGRLMSRFQGQGAVFLGRVRRPNARTAILLLPEGMLMAPIGVGVAARTRLLKSGSSCERACVDRVPDSGFLGAEG